jgi:cytochrome c
LPVILLLCGAVLTPASVGHAGSSPPDGTAIPSPHLGRPATASDIAAMELSVGSDGSGLPAGSGTVAQGKITYAAQCAACHGDAGSGAIADRLTGGVGSFASKKPLRSAASYWPYAPSLFDYIRRAMPYTQPQSLSDDEVYGVVAYLLSIDHIVPPNARLDAKRLARIEMPNRHGFVSLGGRNFDGNIEGNYAPH